MPFTTPTAALAFAIMAIIYVKNKNKNKRRKHRWWSKELFRRRMQYGNRLLRDLVVEPINDTIRNFTRMTSQDFEYLLSQVDPIIRMNTNMREALTSKERLAVTLRFLATGDSYTSLQYLFRISKSSISRIIPEVCDVLLQSIKEYVKVSSTTEEWLQIAAEFESKWNFPHVIGAMDEKHIVLQAPINSGTEYYNYKHFFSIVLFALVDANYNFIYADIGCRQDIGRWCIQKYNSIQQFREPQIKYSRPQSLQIANHFVLNDPLPWKNNY